MFNYVTIPCPHCGVYYEDQAKWGSCDMSTATIFEADPAEQLELSREGTKWCKACDQTFHVHLEITCTVRKGDPSGSETADRIVAFIKERPGCIKVLYPASYRAYIIEDQLLNPDDWEDMTEPGEEVTWVNEEVSWADGIRACIDSDGLIAFEEI